MDFLKNISLKPYNTFGIDVKAEQFIEVTSESELIQALQKHPNCFILGGGSNMLLIKNLAQPVVKISIKGITETVIRNDPNHILVTAKAGENWHDFVLWCIAKNYGGLENLSLIPGTVGACPIQNIGAYGVEVKDSIESVETIDLKTLETQLFLNADCQFGYRDSIFKSSKKGQYIIIKVTFKLSTSAHQINLEYGAIKTALEGIQNPSLKQISDAVIAIRDSKLPNPKALGNSGSFFKNPVVDVAHFKQLKLQYPNMPSYRLSKSQIKIPAGWLIEQSGFKGKRFGDAGVHNKQALVLVNYGQATGSEILKLAENIQDRIYKQFNIKLQTEVNIFS